MKDKGYIMLSRKFFDHDLWSEERVFSKAEAWMDLIASARYEATPGKKLIGYKKVTWNRGQLPVSYRFLAERWNWSTKKVGKFIQLLENEEMIKYETQEETGQSLVTICNYDIYNTVSDKEETPKETRGKQGGRQGGRQNSNKGKEREERKSKESACAPPSSDELKFNNWMTDNFPRVQQLKEPLTYHQITRIREHWTSGQIKDVLESMENFKELHKKYVSASKTLANWLRRRDTSGVPSEVPKVVEATDKIKMNYFNNK